MDSVFMSLLPDGLLIVMGACLRNVVPREGWAGIDRLNFQLLFPALLFFAASRHSPAPGDLVMMGTGVWAIILLGVVLAYCLRPVGPESFLDFAGLWQTAWRFNTALALVVVQVLPPEAAALMSVAVGLAVPMANFLAVLVLSRGQSLSLFKTIRMIALNPFLIGSLLGLLVAVFRMELPEPVMTTASRFAQAALPVALLSIGASLDFKALLRFDPFMSGLNMIKLLLLPLAAFLITQALGVPRDPACILVIFAALPTASAAHVLASVFGADKSRVATMIAQSTLLSCLSLPFWISMAQG
ncbi:AEC family transporter [Kiloniella sp. b19]|uniref:AEC family transporter n=1 Tax=Kiloniella sp. GXU_MW_B19 TaxID=3141326 RepID=UPI0031DB27F6